MPSSPTVTSTGGRWFLAALGCTLVLIGVFFTWLLWRSFERAREMHHWPAVPAVILGNFVDERHEFGDTHPSEFRFELTFGYEWHQQSYTSDQLTLRGAPWSTDRSTAAEMAERYPVGKKVTALVNPEDPTIAVLEADSLAPGYSLWFPMLLVIGGTGICYRSVRPNRKKLA